MNVAYLVMAHANPLHLARLIRALKTPWSSVLVHIDGKVDIRPFLSAGIESAGAHLCNSRVPVYWAEYSQVEATLLLIRQALSARPRPDYLVLISGADYPIRSSEHIKRFFEENSEGEFINMVPMPNAACGKPLSRLTDYKVLSGARFARTERAVRFVLKRAHILPLLRDVDDVLRERRPYGGSTWWALSSRACSYIDEFVRRETRIIDFFRNTWCPDEMFFQTIIGNSPFQHRVRRNLTYTDWPTGGAHPRPIDERHLQYFDRLKVVGLDAYGEGELLFARKFGPNTKQIVDQLDDIREKWG